MSVTPEDPSEPVYIARVVSLWQQGEEKWLHAAWLSRGSETVLGEASDPSELFVMDSCGDSPLGALVDKVTVTFSQPELGAWCLEGGREQEVEEEEANDTHFFVQKFYDSDTARFEDIPEQHLTFEPGHCCSCVRNAEKVRCSQFSRVAHEMGVSCFPGASYCAREGREGRGCGGVWRLQV